MTSWVSKRLRTRANGFFILIKGDYPQDRLSPPERLWILFGKLREIHGAGFRIVGTDVTGRWCEEILGRSARFVVPLVVHGVSQDHGFGAFDSACLIGIVWKHKGFGHINLRILNSGREEGSVRG
jgi:hypothetical protein